MQPEPITVTPTAQPQTVQIPGVSQTPNGVVVQPSVVVQDVGKAVESVKTHYASPAFWYHAMLQVLVWTSYFQTASTPVQVGSMSVSLLGFVAYLFHLVKVMRG